MKHFASKPLPLALLLLVAVSGCRDVSRANGTAVFVQSDVRAIPGGNQLSLGGREGASTVFGPSTLPYTQDHGVLVGTPTVRVLIADIWAGHTVVIHGELLGAGNVLGTADSAPVEIVLGKEVDALLVLQRPVPDGGTAVDGGVAVDGGRSVDAGLPEDSGTGCAGCAGCCLGSVCVEESLDHCGPPGATCFRCDPTSSNTCLDGACGCGGGPTCGSGARCESGSCVCDASTCPRGCCEDDQCLPGDSPTACGKNGGACEQCTTGKGRCDGQHCH